jgi:hypothetical protein
VPEEAKIVAITKITKIVLNIMQQNGHKDFIGPSKF